jgi:4'-phosphopantetheinyl transferase EntD
MPARVPTAAFERLLGRLKRAASCKAIAETQTEAQLSLHLGYKVNGMRFDGRRTQQQNCDSAREACDLSRIGSLFPAGTELAVLRDFGAAKPLYELEARHVRKAAPKRIEDFAAGRHCASLALEKLGFAQYPLEMKDDRTPAWPQGIVGSITHTDGFAAAAVASAAHCISLGLDAEKIDRVAQDVWTHICSQEEINRIRELQPDKAAFAAALIFSAKEAFYKCQYPITGEFLDFQAGRVNFGNIASASGPCSFTMRPGSAIERLIDPPYIGRWYTDGCHIVTGFYFGR